MVLASWSPARRGACPLACDRAPQGVGGHTEQHLWALTGVTPKPWPTPERMAGTASLGPHLALPDGGWAGPLSSCMQRSKASLQRSLGCLCPAPLSPSLSPRGLPPHSLGSFSAGAEGAALAASSFLKVPVTWAWLRFVPPLLPHLYFSGSSSSSHRAAVLNSGARECPEVTGVWLSHRL